MNQTDQDGKKNKTNGKQNTLFGMWTFKRPMDKLPWLQIDQNGLLLCDITGRKLGTVRTNDSRLSVYEK